MALLDYEHLTARLFFRAAFPVMKVVIQDDPSMAKKFKDVVAKVQIKAKDGEGYVGACLYFDKGEFKAVEEIIEEPDMTLSFSSVEKMNDMFRGGNSLPWIKGLHKIGLLTKILPLLLSLKLMMPDADPKDPVKKALKVKMTLYMITTAVSQYNKAGVEAMQAWTLKQPDRIYQFSIDEEDIAAYIRIKGGKSKAGRGVYKRRSPFVHFNFHSVDGALNVLGGKVAFVEGVEKGYVSVIGAPEYSSKLNDFMSTIQDMLVK